jgi:hypothetical protein
MDTVLFPVLAINSDTSRTVHRALVIQTVKQTVHLTEKIHRDVTTAQLLTHVADSSRCAEHIFNPQQHRKRHVKAVKTEGSMKLISGSQHMKSGSTKTSDQCLSIDR